MDNKNQPKIIDNSSVMDTIKNLMIPAVKSVQLNLGDFDYAA